MHTIHNTNIQIIKTNYQQRKTNDKYEENFSCVLLTTGSFNPIHRGHLRNLIWIKTFLEKHPKRPLNVLAAYLSPTHDSYVKNKLGNSQWIPSVHRVRLCEAAINDEGLNDWISVSRGECEYPEGFVDFDSVTERLAMFLNQQRESTLSFLKNPLKIVYVSGLDHFNRCSYAARLAEQENLACVVIYRPGQDENRIKKLQETHSNVYYADLKDLRNKLEDISSTMIRQGDPIRLRHLTYDAVIEYLQNCHIDHYQKNKT